ncbi:MAG: hypothetical protein AB7R90_03125 [Reyranellaceae bacterium]
MSVWRARLMGLTLTVVVGATLLLLFGDWLALQAVAGAGYLAFVLLVMVRAVPRDYWFVGAAAALSVAVLAVRPDPWPVLGKAVLMAAYFTTFLLALNMLRDAARSSVAVRRCGNYVIAQPPGRRYIALTAAAHVFAMILSYGVVNLLGTMVKRANTMAAAGGDRRRFKIREKRMMLAVLRGQCTMVGWSPLSILIALTVSLVPGLTWTAIAPVGAVCSALFLTVGWALDRIEWRAPAASAAPLMAPRYGFARSVPPMLAVLAGIMAMVTGANMLLSLSMVGATMLMLPFFSVLWIAVQFRRLGPRRMLAMTRRRVGRWPTGEFVASRSEALIISTAAYIGAVLAALIPEDAIETLIARADLPWLALAIAMAAVVTLVGQIGVNSLVMLTLIGSSLHHMPADGLPSVLLAVALLGGSSLSIASSPYGTPVVLIGSLTGESPEKIGRAWNGPFTIAAFVVLCLYLAAIDWLRP